MGKKKIIILIALVVFGLLVRLSILFFGFDKICEALELTRGTVARELINGINLPLSDHIKCGLNRNNQSGVGPMLIERLVVPFFLLFGDSYLTLKLVPLVFYIVSLIVFYLFLYKFFNRYVAVIASLLFILSPPIFTKLSFMCWGSHPESFLFTISSLYLFYEIIFGKKHHPVYFLLFALVCAAGVCFDYIFLITLFTHFIIWFIFDKKFFLKKQFHIFLVSFLSFIFPWFYYFISIQGNINIYSIPIYKHFQNNSLNYFLIRMNDFLSSSLFNSIAFENLWFINGAFLSIFYYLIIIISFCSLVWENIIFTVRTKLIFYRSKMSHLTSEVKKNISKDLFILVYIVAFCLSYGLTDFIIGKGKLHFTNYRYMFPLFPFISIMIAQFLDKLRTKRNIYLVFSSCLIASGLFLTGFMGNLNLISPDKFAEGIKYEGFSMPLFSIIIGREFSNDLNKSFSIIEQIDKDDRDTFYAGFAMGLFERLKGDTIASLDIINKQIDRKYRYICYIGLGFAFGQVVWEEGASIMKGIDLIKQLEQKYKPYFYRGLGSGMAQRIFWGVDSIKYIEETINDIDPSYRSLCYQGIGLELGLDLVYNISDYIYDIEQLNANFRSSCYQGLGMAYGVKANYNNITHFISKINQVQEDYKGYCYQGLGQWLFFKYSGNINKYIAVISKVSEKYRPYCYYGAGLATGAKYGYDTAICIENLNRLDKKYREKFLQGLKDSADPALENEALLDLNYTN